MKLPLIIISLIISVAYTSQIKEAKLELEKKEKYSTIYDLKENGILIATYKSLSSHPYYNTKLTAYDNDLNIVWVKENLSISPSKLKVSLNGNGAYASIPHVNGIAISKFTLYNFSNPKNTKGVEIKFKDYGYTDVTNNDFLNINITRTKTNIEYHIDTYSPNLEKETVSIAIPIPPYKRNSSWNQIIFKDNIVLYQKNFIDVGKRNKEKKHKLKIDYVIVNNKKEIVQKELIASHETSDNYRTNQYYYSNTPPFYNNNLKYYRNHLNGDNYLVYLNKSEDGFYLDCFNHEGEFKWTIEKKIKGTKALKNLYKSSTLYIKVFDSGLLGLDFRNKNVKITSRYFINDDGKVLEEKNISYDKNISLVDDFIINYNHGKMARKIAEKSKELEKKREMGKARYSYLLKEKYDILLVYINGQINIIKFEK